MSERCPHYEYINSLESPCTHEETERELIDGGVLRVAPCKLCNELIAYIPVFGDTTIDELDAAVREIRP